MEQKTHSPLNTDTVFQCTKDDDNVALSIQDDYFLDIMEQGFQKVENNGWIAPLPFKKPTDNKTQAMKRLSLLLRIFEEHFVPFMERMERRAVAFPRL